MASASNHRADSPVAALEVDDHDYSKRCMSNVTATSISSFPDSVLLSETDDLGPFYSTAKPRPTYCVRSSRRSPLPNDRLSPSLQPSRHANGRQRSRDDATSHSAEQRQQPAPLVLLHVTVLPTCLPWSRKVLDATLPFELKHRLASLRAQVSGLVSKRGILIAHPHEEFEILEERVLEALDLLPERIGPDGQYRPRMPTALVDTEQDLETAETTIKSCDTCQRYHQKDDGTGWHIRVYAAIGLMRAGAWSAAWNEMERVDVEILPCISHEVRQRLDNMQASEEAIQEDRVPSIVTNLQTLTADTSAKLTSNELATLGAPEKSERKQLTSSLCAESIAERSELPPAYRPKEIPLGLLLRNYVYLLACDRRNILILILTVMLIVSTLYGAIREHSTLHLTGSLEGDMARMTTTTPSQSMKSTTAASFDETMSTLVPQSLRVKSQLSKKHADNVRPDPTETVSLSSIDTQTLRGTAAPSSLYDNRDSRPTISENMVPASNEIESPLDLSQGSTIVSPNPAFLPGLHGMMMHCR